MVRVHMVQAMIIMCCWTGWVAGLENPGNTCFLNAVLQSLAACRSWVIWLERCQHSYHVNNNSSLFGALHNTITALNEPEISRGCCSPQLVITALRANRWVITNEEQILFFKDASEERSCSLKTLVRRGNCSVFTFLAFFSFSALDQVLFFKDANEKLVTVQFSPFWYSSVSPLLTRSCSLMTPMKKAGNSSVSPFWYSSVSLDQILFFNDTNEKQILFFNDTNEKQDAHELYHVLTSTLEEEETRAKKVILSFSDLASLEKPDVSPVRAIVGRGGMEVPSAVQLGGFSSPTRGLMANQLRCQMCGYHYPVCYDTFDSVSLVLPSAHPTLHDCLRKFISPEVVLDGVCEKCSGAATKTTFIKQLTFGKVSRTQKRAFFFSLLSLVQAMIIMLPECLCFHLQRTIWLPNMPVKKFEHVSFPEFLDMDSYLYCRQQSLARSAATFPWARLIGGTYLDLRLPLGSLYQIQPTGSNGLGESSKSHLYQLQAVVVHIGDMYSGHFITYRRSPYNSTDWFCTSDAAVRRVTISEVLGSTAFMLFYEAYPSTSPSTVLTTQLPSSWAASI
ncbi:USP30 [Cordylochernes scorpioides]|uniref:Ubiquitin carboxyl-terminal hydrolase n=1 Tax=Cordylochernes scorpioides TaxID=51811 RepID=A0ABY6LG80_9ARAC|nr:USP30 [Cordylochernes scorpioides]